MIKHIISMKHRVTSVTTVVYFSLKFTPGIWVYPCISRCALNYPYFFFLKNHFE